MGSMTGPVDETRCPLCGGQNAIAFYRDGTRNYLRCQGCRLVFVPEGHWPDAAEARATYDLHLNDPRDQGYRRFLSRLALPLLAKIDKGSQGLDFGCGPGPTLSLMLEENGHHVALYDPLYYPDRTVLQKRYDFICATEVVEHLRRPGADFAALFGMLKPGGWLGIMTKLVIDQEAFRRWHYIRDRTHICFYSRDTLAYIARRFRAELSFAAPDVMLIRNTAPGSGR